MLQNVDIEALKSLYNETFFSMMFAFFFQNIELNLLEQKETEQIVDQRKAWYKKQQLIPNKVYYSNLISKLCSFDKKKNEDKQQQQFSHFNSEYLSQFDSEDNIMKNLQEICQKWTNEKFQHLENFSRWSDKFIEYPQFTSTNKYDSQAQIDAMDVIRYLFKNQSKMEITTYSFYQIIKEVLLQKTNLNKDQQTQTEVQYNLINYYQLDEKNENDHLNSQELLYEVQQLKHYENNLNTNNDNQSEIKLPANLKVKTKSEIHNKFLKIQNQPNQ